ncbi:MAG: hypothetical protein JW840_06635 [Candidatus Thermoplasmatota archaeon]|nr:hypothetical protein [Candidatus Thermoplasmatota archaeon]
MSRAYVKMIPMRRAVVLLTIFLFCSFSFRGFAASTTHYEIHADSSLQDISLQDDAFHGRGRRPFIEWWYFDAKFENDYTVTFGIQVVEMIAFDIVTVRLTIYNQGEVILKKIEKSSLNEFVASSSVPCVAIGGQQLIVGSYEKDTDRFIYNVTYESSEGSISLQFIGYMNGWKRQQQAGDWWAVIFPRADVTGTISIGSTKMQVTGTGYHDHNWHVRPHIVLNYGWLWGTCHSSTYTVTWAEICRTRMTTYPQMVINGKDGTVLDIPSETIWFSQKDTHIDHLRLIPWFFNIETMTEKVFLVINMKVVAVDYTELLGFISYWRYHIQCSGTIVLNGHMETVEGISIMEYLRFR